MLNSITSSITQSAKIKNNDDQKYYLTKFSRRIGNHIRKKSQNKTEKVYTADFVNEISKFFISCGTNNEIIFYTKDPSLQIENYNSYFTDDWVFNLLEIEENNILVTQGKKIELIRIIQDKNNFLIYLKLKKSTLYTLRNGENYFVSCQNKVLLYDSNLIQRNIFVIDKVLLDKYTIKAAIKINNFALFKSNKICSMGSDHILIYNLLSYKRVYNKLDEYSFIYSQNGLSLLSMNIKSDINNKIINKKILLYFYLQYF